MIFILVLVCCVTLSGGHSCVDNPEVNQRGTDKINSGRQVIVPNARINCTGRIAGITVSMDFVGVFTNDFPMIQLWRPSSPGSSVYNNISQVELSMGISVGLPAYFYINVSTNVSMDFQSDDVIGYYQPPQPRRVIWNIQTSGYTSYSNNVNSPSTTIDINNVDNVETNRQPLIELQFDIRCDNLSTPSNGEITSCSSGREGVGYEGDTCNFTCNTGYELTGSDTRTCQSDGSWSGSDDVCRRVHCPSLTSPNGTYRCNLGSDGVTSYDDICRIVCNTGYELIGGDTRTCKSDGSWSGSNDVCRRVPCPSLADSNNGTINCSLGDDGVPSYEDTCNFTCNTGYELTGSDTRTCQSDGSWSGTINTCSRVPCPSLTDPNNGIITCSLGDDGVPSYEDTCNFTCNTGYELAGSDTRTCQSDGSWSGSDDVCRRVQCPPLTNGTLQCTNGTTTGVFEDTCTFSCNGGYELQGSNSGTCLADQSWSEGDPICVVLNCSTSPPVDNSQLQLPCDTKYQSTCVASCDEGYTRNNVTSVTYLCNVTSDPTMVDWVPIGGVDVMCERVQCPPLPNGTLQCPNGTTTGLFEDGCTFSCNGGYELQGSNSGTCLVNQSWSGGLPSCVPLNCTTSTLLDGIIPSPSCSLVYQSQCTLSCDEGFTGDDVTYLCNITSDPTMVDWVPIGGVDVMCGRVQCPPLTNGALQCPNETTTGVFEDTCTFSCNGGYELQGSNSGTCLADQRWSGGDPICVVLNCSTSPPLDNSQLQLPCDTQYQSTCTTVCVDGYTGGGGSYTCDVTDVGNTVEWSGTTSCQRVNCSSLTDPNNGMMTCSLGDDGVPSYEDTCNFTCNAGYELTGSDTRTCQSDGSWSGKDDVCRRDGNSDGKSGSLSGGVIIGAAVGGALLIIAIVAVILVVVFCVRQSQLKEAYLINSSRVPPEVLDTKKSKGSDTQNGVTGTIDTRIYYELTPPPAMPDYENVGSPKCDIMDTSLTNVEGMYETAAQYQSLMSEYETSNHSLSDSLEREKQIYNTPFKDEKDYGPDYEDPPSNVHKIYQEFEGEKFHKIHRHDIRSLEQLGVGEFGVINRAMWEPSTGKEIEVAVKSLNTDADEKDKLRSLQEAAIMCQFDHENVIKLYGVVTEAPAMIVLEYMSRGDLSKLLIKLRRINQTTAHQKLPIVLLKFCKEIVAGMAYLSGKKFVHRDLAARNILVSDRCKIADFGMSRDLLDDNYYITSGGKVPVKWTAPEALHYRKYSIQSDVWSYGCVLYEIWSLGYKPFEGFNINEAIEKVDNGYRLSPPPGCPRTLYRMMMKCWHPDPRSRPQFGQITKLLAGNGNYLLGWSVEDKKVAGEDGIKLGASLGFAKNLYPDLQLMYKQ